ncbi:MAG: amino acid ABC transporter permease [Pseudomonadota bacterium]
MQSRRASDLLIFTIGAGLLAWLIYLGATGMGYNWQWYRVPRYIYRVIDGELILGPLVKGLLVTLQITFWSAVLALGIGLATAILRLSRSLAGYGVATAYLELARNTPLLVQMFLFYFVLAPIFDIERFWTGVICLAFFEAAFISEIIRGGILSVQRGQWEAASALGLTSADVYAKVVLPQALPIMLPPLTNAIVNLIKNSAIVSTIAIFDLTTEGRNIIADTFMSFEIWFTVAAIYLALTLSLSTLVGVFERRVGEANKH